MGRKSKTKKIIRELIQEKEQKEKLKILQKKEKKEIKKEHKKINLKLKVSKNRIFGLILTIIMGTILVSVGFLLFQKAFKPIPIAKYLPTDRTIFILEINSNFEHNQVIKALKLLEKYEEFSKNKLTGYIEKISGLNYENEIKPWLGREVGLTVIKSKDKTKINYIYFAEIYSKKNAQKFLMQNVTKSNYDNYEINFNESIQKYLTFIDNYAFLSQDESAIKELIDSQNSNEEKIFSSEDYRKINNNIPLNKTIFAFINFAKIPQKIFDKYEILNNAKFFINSFNSEGIALIALDDKFAIQSFLNLNTGSLKDNQYISLQEKYSAELTKYIPENISAFWGGKNLEYQVKRTVTVLSGEESALQSFDILLENYTQKYFGAEISLNNDILPLLKNEFALTLGSDDQEKIYSLIIKLEEPENEKLVVDKIIENYAKTSAAYEEEVVDYILPDGTYSQEIIEIPGEIDKKQNLYKGIQINEIYFGEEKEGIFYAIVDSNAIISNNIKGVKTVIDIANKEQKSLQESKIFENLINPILKNSDEISYFNFEKLLPILFDGQNIPEFVEPISSLSGGKNYFNDGLSTINYLHIK